MEAFEEATKHNPEDADTHYQKGIALFKLGEYEKAENAFEEGSGLNPKDARAHNYKGKALAKQGEK